jgi:hypothetical protein
MYLETWQTICFLCVQVLELDDPRLVRQLDPLLTEIQVSLLVKQVSPRVS